jgi:hypothetical protein
MIKQRTMGLAVAICVFGVITTPAFAEFQSYKDETRGSGEIVELNLESGGGTVSCQAYSESKSAAGWTIENEGKPATKGPDLAISVEKWGECNAKSGELKEVKAEVKGCEVEAKDPGEETRATGKLLTTCTVKAGTCEIIAEPKENKELTGTYVYSSGEKEENLILRPSISGVTTTTKGTCPGIKPSKEGKMFGVTQLLQISPVIRVEYTISVNKYYYTPSNNTGTATITRRGSLERPNGVENEELPNLGKKYFILEESAFNVCRTTKLYNPGESCNFNVTYSEPGSDLIIVHGLTQYYSAIEVSGT